jgi:hypothetical protein
MTESWGNFESPEEKASRERDERREDFNIDNRSREDRRREIEEHVRRQSDRHDD